LDGKIAVITGAGSGIGLATARRLSADGARVVCADVDASTGQAAADEVGGLFVQVDVTDEGAVAALFNAAVDAYGGIDVSFHNAGISPTDDDSSTRPSTCGGTCRRSTSPPCICAAGT
jgi:NAD(P)-dependent dehydrogenase (short-subunit alcohol dehydrogenase family)